MEGMLKSCLCTQLQLETKTFRDWSEKLRTRHGYHRKLWEFGFIAQALHERGQLGPGRRGIGFGVGKEPLVALFANLGCSIVATDQAPETAIPRGWHTNNQYMESLDALNENGLCEPALFRERVSTRHVDMNRIPDDLRGFDFSWSAGSLDHCGSLVLASDFLLNQLDCLKSGGVAAHTTEYNTASEEFTISQGDTVWFRRRDVEDVARRCAELGHRIDLDLTLGDGAIDLQVDEPPYTHNPHLRLRIGEIVATSIGLIIEKDALATNRSRRGRFRDLMSRLGHLSERRTA